MKSFLIICCQVALFFFSFHFNAFAFLNCFPKQCTTTAKNLVATLGRRMRDPLCTRQCCGGCGAACENKVLSWWSVSFPLWSKFSDCLINFNITHHYHRPNISSTSIKVGKDGNELCKCRSAVSEVISQHISPFNNFLAESKYGNFFGTNSVPTKLTRASVSSCWTVYPIKMQAQICAYRLNLQYLRLTEWANLLVWSTACCLLAIMTR